MGTDIKLPSSFFIGKARAVYLVNDASDEAALRGAGHNVYRTFQAAYDAANTLQAALGGTNIVVIMVGNTRATTVGNVVLTTIWNTRVHVVGVSAQSSNLGTITGAAGGSITSYFSNVTIGDITVSGSGGMNLILKESIIGNLTSNGININVQGTNSRINSVTMNANGAVGNFGIQNSYNLLILGSINMIQTNLIVDNSVGMLYINQSSDVIFEGVVTIKNNFVASTSTVGGLNVTSTCNSIQFKNTVSIESSGSSAASDSIITNVVVNNAAFHAGLMVNTTSSSYTFTGGGAVANLVLNNCDFDTNVYIASNRLTPYIIATSYIRNCRLMSASLSDTFMIKTNNTSYAILSIEDISMPIYLLDVPTSGISFLTSSGILNLTGCDKGITFEILGEGVLGQPVVNIENSKGNFVLTRRDYSLEVNIKNCSIADFTVNDTGTTSSNYGINIYSTNIDSVLGLPGMFSIGNGFNVYDSSIFIKYSVDFVANTCSNSLFSNDFAGAGVANYHIYNIQNCVFASYAISGIIMDDSTIGNYQNVSYVITGGPIGTFDISSPTPLNRLYNIVNITSGTFIQGGITNYYAYSEIIFKNSGTGIVTLNVGITIDDLPTYILLGGSSVKLFFDPVTYKYKAIS